MNPWRSEVVERLREHLAKGLSGSQCAAALYDEFKHPFSRNSVIGKVLRAGLQFMSPCSPWARLERAKHRGVDGNRQRPTKFDKPPMERRSRPALKAAELTSLPADQSPHAVSLLDLREDQCRWPVDGGLWCGAAKMPPNERNWQSSFCRRHHKLAYRPARPNGGVTNAM